MTAAQKKTTDAPKTRASKDPAAAAKAAVKRAEGDLGTAGNRLEKARAAVEKQQQSLATAQQALATVEAEHRRAEQVLAYAKAHPLLAPQDAPHNEHVHVPASDPAEPAPETAEAAAESQ